MFIDAELEHPKRTNREIIFEEFQPMRSRYQRYGQLAVAIPRSASHCAVKAINSIQRENLANAR